MLMILFEEFRLLFRRALSRLLPMSMSSAARTLTISKDKRRVDFININGLKISLIFLGIN
jgi:hypothetical protein